MNFAVVYSRASQGIEAPTVMVETHIANGLPGLHIVGLPETAVKESKDRVRSAIINSQFDFPARKIVINLAPADLPKEGSRFDLPIALGILAASNQLPNNTLKDYEFAGELALNGALRSIPGSLPFSLAARKTKRKLIVPHANAQEAGLVNNAQVYPATHLLDVCAHLLGKQSLACHQQPSSIQQSVESLVDFAEVKGQHQAKRALEIAAAGQHSAIMIGPPGTGKTMLASRLSSILPPLTEDEALESAAIYSISKKPLNIEHWQRRPFRTPHHSASSVALVGGSSPPRPGEISLAHNGVLFLDELPEFQRTVLEALREPLESGSVTISRAAYTNRFPARFQFIAAMNPCPCGYAGDPKGRCQCTADQIKRYQNKISGPILDRIDLHIEVPALPKGIFASQKEYAECSNTIRQRVMAARNIQQQRNHRPNAALSSSETYQHCQLTADDQLLLDSAMEKLGLSARAYHRILRIARTIADLAQSKAIHTPHLTEALSYRRLDRNL